MDVQQVEKDMYVLVGETYQSNSLILTKGDDALLIDAMASQRDAERLRGFVESDLKKIEIYDTEGKLMAPEPATGASNRNDN